MKKFKGLGITIVLGIVGSGLWEKCFSPLIDFLFKFVVEIFSKVSSGYENSLYKAASYGFTEAYSLQLYILSYVLISGIYFGIYVGVVKSKKYKKIKLSADEMDTEELSQKIEELDEIIKKEEKYLNSKVIFVLAIIVLILSVYQGSKQTKVNSIIVETRSNIEILAPYISDNEYKKMYSEFYSMDSKQDYLELVKKLKTKFDVNDLEYKEFKSTVLEM